MFFCCVGMVTPADRWSSQAEIVGYRTASHRIPVPTRSPNHKKNSKRHRIASSHRMAPHRTALHPHPNPQPQGKNANSRAEHRIASLHHIARHRTITITIAITITLTLTITTTNGRRGSGISLRNWEIEGPIS